MGELGSRNRRLVARRVLRRAAVVSCALAIFGLVSEGRAGTCVGGFDDGQSCASDTDRLDLCVGGTNAGGQVQPGAGV